MMPPDRKSPVTLEDLLRLKRAERPSPEFWVQFERELRAKQLAAIVAKRPWWASYARVFGGLARHPVPIGATVALALSFAGYHGYQLSHMRRISSPAPATMELAQVPAPIASPIDRSAAATAESPQADAVPAPVVARAATVAADRDGDSIRIDDAAAVRARGEWQTAGLALASSDSPSARSIAANLATAQAMQPEILHNLLGFSRSLDAVLVPEHHPMAEPLATMRPPSAERRSRLLADALPVVATATETALPSSEHFVSRLSDDRLYESISRYAAGDGGKLAIKVKF